MIEDIKTHFWHYLILILVLSFGGMVFFSLVDKMAKFQVILLLALTYWLWGIWHHHWEDNLNLKIMVEYGLISILSVIVLGGALL